MICKYVERNNLENKCSDYYVSHAGNKTRYKCRLSEWKKKLKVCPYDKKIKSCSRKPKAQMILDLNSKLPLYLYKP